MTEFSITRRSFGALSAAGIVSAALPNVALAQSSLEAIKSRGTLRVGWAIWVPYMFLDPATRQKTGITVSLVEALTAQLGVKPEYVETSWATMVAGIQAGQYDMTMPLGVSEERAKAVTFTNPVVNQNWGLVVPKDKVGNYQSWQDLNKPSMRISASMGSTGVKFLQALDKAQHLLVKDGSDSIAQLMSNQADAWMCPFDTARTAQQKQPNLALVPGPAIAKEAVALSVRKNDLELKGKLDQLIAEMKANGQLLALIKQYGLDETSIS